VLEKLVQEKIIQKFHYKFIHFDSKDARGVDVALIYNPTYFTPYQYKIFSLSDSTHFTHYATRDILYVKGQIQNSWVHVLVNHWPSRRGGEKKSSIHRIWAATVCKRIIDSIQKNQPNSQIIVMGDFNDNPNNKSILSLGLDNPFAHLFKKGIGSIAYNDSWHLFDQILLSKDGNRAPKENSTNFTLTNYKPIIYKAFEMIETEGRYQGYPKRTYNGDHFRAGYSDHFPVALIFSLKMTGNPLN
jgi:exonuclease III